MASTAFPTRPVPKTGKYAEDTCCEHLKGVTALSGVLCGDPSLIQQWPASEMTTPFGDSMHDLGGYAKLLVQQALGRLKPAMRPEAEQQLRRKGVLKPKIRLRDWKYAAVSLSVYLADSVSLDSLFGLYLYTTGLQSLAVTGRLVAIEQDNCERTEGVFKVVKGALFRDKISSSRARSYMDGALLLHTRPVVLRPQDQPIPGWASVEKVLEFLKEEAGKENRGPLSAFLRSAGVR